MNNRIETVGVCEGTATRERNAFVRCNASSGVYGFDLRPIRVNSRLAEHEETVVQAPDSACTAAEPHPPPTPPHIRVQETVGTLQSQLLDVFDAENLVRIMHQLQIAQSIVVQQICNANRQNRGDVFQEASARTRGQALMKFKGRGQG